MPRDLVTDTRDKRAPLVTPLCLAGLMGNPSPIALLILQACTLKILNPLPNTTPITTRTTLTRVDSASLNKSKLIPVSNVHGLACSSSAFAVGRHLVAVHAGRLFLDALRSQCTDANIYCTLAEGSFGRKMPRLRKALPYDYGS